MNKNKASESQDDDLLLYRIAKSYYLNNMTQEAIASRENISRSYVSKLLLVAREKGIVKVKVDLPQEEDIELLKTKLQKATKLSYVEVSYLSDRDKKDSRKVALSIASRAVDVLPEYLKDSTHVGIGWGYTMYQTAQNLSTRTIRNDMDFTPIIGVSSANTPYLQTNSIVDRFSYAFAAQSQFINIPIVIDHKSVEGELDRIRLTQIKNHWKRIDTVILGLGKPYRKGEFLLSEASDEYKKIIANSDAVGDILADFFRIDGSEIDTKNLYIKISMPLKQLKTTKKVLCLAGGTEKVEGIYAAIKSYYINGLITDIYTAERLLDCFE